jgi:DNA-binding IclR family transcriptional regulator
MEVHGDIVVVASIPAPGTWGFAIRTGSVLGLSNTATGRVLAAFRDTSDIDILIDSHRLASGEPPFSKDELMPRLHAIKDRGYEFADSDTTEGITNLAFPVFDSFDNAMAVVSCPYVTRKDSIEAPTIDEAINMYAELADNLTEYLSGRPSRIGSEVLQK